jgi:serine/threonine protein kinase
MPTQNRRVATYLPPQIDEPFKSFKSQRNIKGDSEALIAILSEYLQVDKEVAYSSSSNLLQRIEAIEDKLSSLKSELFSELKIELQPQKNESQGSLQSELLIESRESQPQTASLFPNDLQSSSPLESRSELQQISSMTAAALSVRLGVHKDTVVRMKSKFIDNLAAFRNWTKDKDPDGIGWEFSLTNKLYHSAQ